LLDKIQMNRRENLAKTLYDLGKFVFVAFVIGYFINRGIKFKLFVAGFITTMIFFILAYFIDNKSRS